MYKSKITRQNLVTIPKAWTKDWGNKEWVSWEKLPDGGIIVRPIGSVLDLYCSLAEKPAPTLGTKIEEK